MSLKLQKRLAASLLGCGIFDKVENTGKWGGWFKWLLGEVWGIGCRKHFSAANIHIQKCAQQDIYQHLDVSANELEGVVVQGATKHILCGTLWQMFWKIMKNITCLWLIDQWPWQSYDESSEDIHWINTKNAVKSIYTRSFVWRYRFSWKRFFAGLLFGFDGSKVRSVYGPEPQKF